MAVDLSYDAVLSRVRVAVTGQPAHAVSVTVERSTDQVRWTVVRGGMDVPLVDGAATVDDYEFADRTPNYYRAVVRLVEDFEDDTLAFTITDAGDASWARDNTQAHDGTWSLRSGAITHDQVSYAIVTVPTGTVAVRWWYRTDTEQMYDVLEVWRDEETTDLLSASGHIEWTEFTATLVGATTLTLTFRYIKDPSISGGADAVWIDGLAFDVAEAIVSITPQLTSVWAKSIARPFLNRPIVVSTVGDVETEARTGIFEIVGRSLPIAVSDVRSSEEWSMVVRTMDAAANNDLRLMLASGDILFIHVPATLDIPGGYVTVGQAAQRRVRPNNPRRFWTLACRVAAAPGADVVGATATYQSLLNLHATYADVLAAYDSYADILELIGAPEDVIVP